MEPNQTYISDVCFYQQRLKKDGLSFIYLFYFILFSSNVSQHGRPKCHADGCSQIIQVRHSGGWEFWKTLIQWCWRKIHSNTIYVFQYARSQAVLSQKLSESLTGIERLTGNRASHWRSEDYGFDSRQGLGKFFWGNSSRVCVLKNIITKLPQTQHNLC